MSFFVNVRTDRVILRQGKVPIADIYDACGHAALLASDLTDRYSKRCGSTMVGQRQEVAVPLFRDLARALILGGPSDRIDP